MKIYTMNSIFDNNIFITDDIKELLKLMYDEYFLKRKGFGYTQDECKKRIIKDFKEIYLMKQNEIWDSQQLPSHKQYFRGIKIKCTEIDEKLWKLMKKP